jgi:SAM-dependent methyltransferase
MLDIRRNFYTGNNASARERWVQNQLSTLSPGGILLDAGCGPQKYKKYCAHLTYRTQDFGQYDGHGDKVGLQDGNWEYGHLDYLGNIWDIDESNETFDVILCTEVLEHIPFPNETIEEFARLLKPGGIVLLTAPFCCIPHQTPYYFYTGFSKEWYQYVAQKNGFIIHSIETNGNQFDYVAQEYIRAINSMKNMFLRCTLKVISYLTVVSLFKIFSNKSLDTHPYLHFGYHVKMVKA